MATTEELLSLQRKIALDSYHQTTKQNKKAQKRKRPTIVRPRSLSTTDSNKSSKPNSKPSKLTKTSKSTHTNSSHLPSMPKPFKKIFKQTNHHSQSKSLNIKKQKKNNKKPKSKHSSHNSDSQLPTAVNIQKLIDKSLLKQYQIYVEERVEMLRSRAFPNEVIFALPQYRADLTHSLDKIIPKPHFSRHRECDQLIKADLLKEAKRANEHSTKLKKSTHKGSKLKSIKNGISKPIKSLFVTQKQNNNLKIEVSNTEGIQPLSEDFSPENECELVGINAILSPNSNLEHKFNITHSDIDNDNDKMESTASVSNDTHTKNESVSISQMSQSLDTQILSSLQPTQTNLEISPFPFADDARKSAPTIIDHERDRTEHTPLSCPPNNILQHRYTLDVSALPKNKTELIRAQTTQLKDRRKHFRSASDPSPTPPFIFTQRTNNIRNAADMLFEKTLRSNTPSWALKESSEAETETNIKKSQSVSVLFNDDFEILSEKYNELELLCNDLQISLARMDQTMTAQSETMERMCAKMERMENERMVSTVKSDTIETVKSESSHNNTHTYFDFGYFWNIFAEKKKGNKVLSIISFERSKWENIYHSLLMYFMNGLMVIFGGLLQLWLFVAFIGQFVLCCFWDRRKKNETKTIHLNDSDLRNITRRNQGSSHQRSRMRRRNHNHNDENVVSSSFD